MTTTDGSSPNWIGLDDITPAPPVVPASVGPARSVSSPPTAPPDPPTSPPPPAGGPLVDPPPPLDLASVDPDAHTKDPRWAPYALGALLVVTAALYLWDLGASGWANSFYSAAVQAGTQSWKAAFFGSSDAANLITVDKSPLSLWPSILLARVVGVNSWSILVPQALMGVGSVAALYAAVRRWHGAVAGLIAGAVLALTPVAALMFRFNNPDAMLVLLLTLSAYALVRALESGSRRWVIAVGVAIGLAFLAKSLQAFLVVPGFAVVWMIAAPTSARRRLVDLVLGGAAMVVAGGWWVAIVEWWPASSRPYIGGTQNNSVLDLIFGYNGFGRLNGNETGSVTPGGGLGGGTSMWGSTGLTRLFNSEFGGQISWLLPAALVLGAALLVVTLRRPRTDRVRASALLWGSWLVVTGLTISLGQGIIHPYYTVALAPAIGGLVGIGSVELWRRRGQPSASAALATASAVTGVWAYVLLGRSPDWNPWLRPTVLVLGLAGALGLAFAWRLPRRIALGMAAMAGIGALLGPTAYALETVTTPHTGSIPSAGPAVVGGGFGGRGGFGPGGQLPAGAQLPTGGQLPAGAQLPGGGATGGQLPPGGQFPGGAPGGAGAGAAGGLLEGSAPSDELVALLETDADSYTWVAAAVGANSAAGYQLATGDPVMSLGGFNGSDPYPTLAQFQQFVADGRVHFFIAGGGFGGPGGGQNGGSRATSEITSWVESSYTATTVGGVTVYDLSAPGGSG